MSVSINNNNPYKTLGLTPPADHEQIRRAYRRLALRYHPDVNKEPDAQAKFICVKEAYDALSVLGPEQLHALLYKLNCPYGCTKPKYLCAKCGAELCIHNVCMLRIKWVTATIVCSSCKAKWKGSHHR